MHRLLPAVLSLTVLWLCACAPEGPTAFATFNVVPNQNCEYSPQTGGGKFYPIGLYDIAQNGDPKSGGTACFRPYVVNLLVNSYLRSNINTTLGRAEPNVLQLHNAEVKLTDINGSTIVFDRDKKNILPNPFSVSTNNSLFPSTGTTPSTGIASLEAVPKVYSSQLDSFATNNAQIQAHIQIFGTTTGDVDVNFKPFVYPIEICDGCLTACLSRVVGTDAKLTRMEAVKNNCDDNAGADDRVCFDPDC